MVVEKRSAYKKGIIFFPTGPGAFDRIMAEQCKRLILDAARALPNPTKCAVADSLGILRDRVTRLLLELGIEREYYDIVRDKRVGRPGRRGKAKEYDDAAAESVA